MSVVSDFWFDASAFEQSRRLAKVRPASARKRLAQFAEANGLTSVPSPEGCIPSLLSGEQAYVSDLVVTSRGPRVEIGNHGPRLGLSTDDLVPARQGRITVRHGLALPHLLVCFAGGIGAKTPVNVASATLNFLNGFTETATELRFSGFRDFRQRGTHISKGKGLAVFAAPGDEEAGRRLLTPDAVPKLKVLAASFAVEIREEWMTAHSYYGDVSTGDPDLWAWVFSVCSRMLELAVLWQEEAPAVAGAVPVTIDAVRALPFYTERRVNRPAKVDGLLSLSLVDRMMGR